MKNSNPDNFVGRIVFNIPNFSIDTQGFVSILMVYAYGDCQCVGAIDQSGPDSLCLVKKAYFVASLTRNL